MFGALKTWDEKKRINSIAKLRKNGFHHKNNAFLYGVYFLRCKFDQFCKTNYFSFLVCPNTNTSSNSIKMMDGVPNSLFKKLKI